MSKVLDETSENNTELNEVKNQKNLCVHELKKTLRVKQKIQFIKKIRNLFCEFKC